MGFSKIAHTRSCSLMGQDKVAAAPEPTGAPVERKDGKDKGAAGMRFRRVSVNLVSQVTAAVGSLAADVSLFPIPTACLPEHAKLTRTFTIPRCAHHTPNGSAHGPARVPLVLGPKGRPTALSLVGPTSARPP